ncbi:carboxylate--amine ligase, partial [bacterium]|nr:carboxylate--amine ligase [bacterium]
MPLSGLKYGAQLLDLVDFPHPEFVTGGATAGEIQGLLDKYGKIVVKPIFHEGVGKKGKADLVPVVANLLAGVAPKKALYPAGHPP